MKKYGNTWWGEKWLDSLSDIDYSNRLPRGRTYANKGAVRDLRIVENVITAKVQGTRKTPYKVSVTVPRFTDSEKSHLISAIKENPLILSKLLNRELPVELNEIALANDIKIFPTAWRDLEMECSCPDWAVPCKHLASVIYIISNAIDRNPFVIFSLHGLDILGELQEIGYQIEEDSFNIPSISDRIMTETKKGHINDPEIDLQDFDFSIIPPLAENLLLLLEDKQLFYAKDFKKVIHKAYKKLSSVAKKEIENISNPENTKDTGQEQNYEKFTELKLTIDHKMDFLDTVFFSEKEEKHFSKKEGGLGSLIDFLSRIPAKTVGRLSTPFLVLVLTYKFSLKLLQQSACIPELLKLNNGKFKIRWIPALMNQETAKIFKSLVKITPPSILKIRENSKKTGFFDGEEQVKALCALFIGYYTERNYGFLSDTLDDIVKFFFSNWSSDFSNLRDKDIPHSIHQWISKFYIHHNRYVPVIKVEDQVNRFFIEILIEDQTDALKEPVRLKKFLTDQTYQSDQMSVLKDLTLLSSSFKELEEVINSKGEFIPEFDSNSFVDILLKILPVMKLYGIRILLPQSLKDYVRPQSSLTLRKNSDAATGKSFLSLASMLEFDWQVALGDEVISADEFFKLVQEMSGIVKVKNQYVLIDPSEIEKLKENLANPPALKSNELLQAVLTEEYDRAKIDISDSARDFLKSVLTIDQIALPQGLNATLRPYQVRGYEWMYKNHNMGIGSIIADDMGLGKTLQVISLLLKMKQEKKLEKQKALVVVPTTLLTNWDQEIQKFAPDLKVSIYHGSYRELNIKECDILITTYGILRSDVQILQKKRWACVVIDEAQNIKNPSTEQTKAVKKMKGEIRIAMSGTPVENRLSEFDHHCSDE